MAFLVILVVLIVQRLTHFLHMGKLPSWEAAFFRRLQRLDKKLLFRRSVYFQTLAILIPLPLAVGILSIIFSRTHVLFSFGFDLIVLWYCLGDSRFKYRGQSQDIGALFTSTYADVFAVIFWFVLLGPAGAVLYTITNDLFTYFDREKVKRVDHIQAVLKIRAILDWVPIRLLGLSFALVGHFFIAASDWLKHLAGGLAMDHNLIAEYGEKAINLQPIHLEKEKEHAVFLIERALWLWLIVLGVVTIALWVG